MKVTRGFKVRFLAFKERLSLEEDRHLVGGDSRHAQNAGNCMSVLTLGVGQLEEFLQWCCVPQCGRCKPEEVRLWGSESCDNLCHPW